MKHRHKRKTVSEIPTEEKKKIGQAVLKALVQVGVALFWIGVWALAAYLVNKPLHLPTPYATVAAFSRLLVQGEFWRIVVFSLARIFLGLLIGTAAGILFAFIMTYLKPADKLLKPLIVLIRTIPVVSFIMLLWLIFFRFRGAMPVAVSALMVFPIVWSGVSDGYKLIDPKLLEMAHCYANRRDTFFYVKLPQIFPQFLSAFSTSVGLSWKAGIAAEVICQPLRSIGREIYLAKEGLESEVQFAWTAVVIVLSLFLEYVLIRLLRKVRFRPHIEESSRVENRDKSYPIEFDDISKHFGKKTVFEHFSHLFPDRKVTAIMGESGCGKSTLLRIAAGLLDDDDKKYEMPPSLPAVIFQEDRLIPQLTVRENLLFANRGCYWTYILENLGLKEVADSYPSQLSGGMRRRVAIARAIAFGGNIGLFDEPFTGLDDKTKAKCAAFLFDRFKNCTVLFVTHDKEDATEYGDFLLEMVAPESEDGAEEQVGFDDDF